VIQRAFAPRTDAKSSRGRRRVWAIAGALLPGTGRATWMHNQALMELGALVCTARVARCGECPVRSLCASAKPSDMSPRRAGVTHLGRTTEART